jgi:hypothetical protein
MTLPAGLNDVPAELDRLVAEFFAAVSFEPGERPRYDRIAALFIERGLLIKNVGAALEISSVSEFVAPRQAMVDAGTLTRFREWELWQRSDVFGNVAQRFCAYGKSGTMNGTAFEARGMIATQFVSTPQGWKISAMAWDDERPGLVMPAR